MWTYFLKYTELKSLGMRDLGQVLLTVLHVILIKLQFSSQVLGDIHCQLTLFNVRMFSVLSLHA